MKGSKLVGGTIAIFSVLLLTASSASAQVGQRISGFDVALNGHTFVADDAPVDANGFPAYGNPFIIEGYIYPEGFLEEHEGINPDGSPSHPDAVIGHFTCRGWFIGDGMATASGPNVMTLQTYEFGENGEETFNSDGIELVDVGVPFERSITGGTGIYRRAAGTMTQTGLGLNVSGAPSVSFSANYAQ